MYGTRWEPPICLDNKIIRVTKVLAALHCRFLSRVFVQLAGNPADEGLAYQNTPLAQSVGEKV